MLRCRWDKRQSQARCLFCVLAVLVIFTTGKVALLDWASKYKDGRSSTAFPTPVSVTGGEIKITGAFLDPRFPRYVRMVGFGRVLNRGAMYCHFQSNTTKARSTADLHSILETYTVVYDGFFIDCPLPDRLVPEDTSLSISLSESNHVTGKPLPLHRIPKSPPNEPTIALCVCPLFGEIPDVHLIAWIEINRLLGVEHFFVYVVDMNPAWENILKFYQAKRVVTRIDWDTSDIPTSRKGVWPPPPREMHYVGQFAAYNDCLYRAGNRFRFLMFTDLDEVIVPRNGTLDDYLASIDESHVASFTFRNSYVPATFLPDQRVAPMSPELANRTPFLRVTREQRVLKRDLGAKAVVKFQNALVMGVHDLMHTSNLSFVVRDVDEHDAVLFHYRTPPRNLRVKDSGRTSHRLQRLTEPLIRAVKEVQLEMRSSPTRTS